MSTYNNVLGNFISHTNDLSDLDDDEYEDSGSEPEPEMGYIHQVASIPSNIHTPDERTQFVESLLSKLSKHACIHTHTNTYSRFSFLGFLLK